MIFEFTSLSLTVGLFQLICVNCENKSFQILLLGSLIYCHFMDGTSVFCEASHRV